MPSLLAALTRGAVPLAPLMRPQSDVLSRDGFSWQSATRSIRS
jgi:hypothetical protein